MERLSRWLFKKLLWLLGDTVWVVSVYEREKMHLCMVFCDYADAMEEYDRMRRVYGGSNVTFVTRYVN